VLNSLLVAKLLEQFVDVRQMVGGHVLDEGPVEFIIANAAIDPAEENDELHQRRHCERPPIGVDDFVHGKECERPETIRHVVASGRYHETFCKSEVCTLRNRPNCEAEANIWKCHRLNNTLVIAPLNGCFFSVKRDNF